MINKTIKVFDKNNNLLAIFDDSVPDTNIAKLNMIQNPIVEITQNGESIFEFTMYVASEKWKNISDPENKYYVNGRVYIAMTDNAFKFTNDIVTVTAVESWYELQNLYIQAYNTPKDREYIAEHSVVLLPKSTDPLVVNGVTYTNNPYPRGSMGYNVWALLQGSGWKLGTCDVLVDGFSPLEDFGVFNIETDQQNVLYTLKLIQSLYGGIFDWDSINKTLNIWDESKESSIFNAWKGYEVRYGKNLKQVSISQNNDIITRLHPLGESKLSIKNANNNGLTYLDDFSYTKKINSRIIENLDIYDKYQLKYWGQRKLKEISRPRKTYMVDFADLRDNPKYEHEYFGLNDVVKIVVNEGFADVIGESKEIIEYKRVVKWRFNVFAPYDSTIECGDLRRNWRDILKQAYDKTPGNSNGNIPGEDIFIRDENENLNDWTKRTKNTLADIQTSATDTEAKIVLLTQYTDANTRNVASIQLTTNAHESKIEYLTQYQTTIDGKVNSSLARIDQISGRDGAQIDLMAAWQGTEIIYENVGFNRGEYNLINGQYVYAGAGNGNFVRRENRTASVSNQAAVSIVAGINGSLVSIKADKINFTGFTTFMKADGAEGDVTYINGNRVKIVSGDNQLSLTEAGLVFLRFKQRRGQIYTHSTANIEGKYTYPLTISSTTDLQFATGGNIRSGILENGMIWTNGGLWFRDLRNSVAINNNPSYYLVIDNGGIVGKTTSGGGGGGGGTGAINMTATEYGSGWYFTNLKVNYTATGYMDTVYIDPYSRLQVGYG